MKNTFKIRAISSLIIVIISLAGCSNTSNLNNKADNTNLTSSQLGDIIRSVRSDEDNAYYSIVNGDKSSDTISTDLEIVGVSDKNIDAYAISSYGITEPTAYTIAIIKSGDKDKIKDDFKNYAGELSKALYINKYEQSVLADNYVTGSIYDYNILVIGEDADSLYSNIENGIITTVDKINTENTGISEDNIEDTEVK